MLVGPQGPHFGDAGRQPEHLRDFLERKSAQKPAANESSSFRENEWQELIETIIADEAPWDKSDVRALGSYTARLLLLNPSMSNINKRMQNSVELVSEVAKHLNQRQEEAQNVLLSMPEWSWAKNLANVVILPDRRPDPSQHQEILQNLLNTASANNTVSD